MSPASFFSTVVPTMLCLGLIATPPATGQGLGGAGTVQGTVKDPTGGVMQAVEVRSFKLAGEGTALDLGGTIDLHQQRIALGVQPSGQLVSLGRRGALKPLDPPDRRAGSAGEHQPPPRQPSLLGLGI